jgi:CelD/BcsL family acetyltransferase involved in cellulose biosynthesis
VWAIETPSDFAKIRESWTTLYERQTQPLPSLHWAWFDSFWRNLASAPAHPSILTVWRDSELLGAAPLARTHRRVAGIRYRAITGLENAHSPAYGWLLPPDPVDARRVATSLVKALDSPGDRCQALAWENALEQHPSTQIVVRALEELSYRVVVRPRRSPALIRFPQGSQVLLASLNKSMRARLRKGWTLLDKTGRVSFEEVSSSSELLDHLAAAWRLEDSTWKGAAGSSIAQSPSLRGFYDDLAIALAPMGKMRLFLLRCDDSLVAFAYVLLDGGIVHGLKIGYSPAFAFASPGYLTVWKIIEWCDHQGIRQFNLSGADASWKSRWGGEPLQVSSVQAFPRTLQGTSMYMALVGWKEQAERIPGTRSAVEFWKRRQNAGQRA